MASDAGRSRSRRASPARRQTSGHRQVGHTADVIVEAWGPDRETCLEEAVRGTVAAFADTRGSAPAAAVPFELEVRGDEDALVRLLEEVIYVVEVKRLLPVDIRVERDAGAGIRGVFHVIPLDRARIVGAAPKAVSWGGLRVAPEHSGLWRAHVTLDV